MSNVKRWDDCPICSIRQYWELSSDERLEYWRIMLTPQLLEECERRIEELMIRPCAICSPYGLSLSRAGEEE